jgi:hypothetical protein
VSYGRINGDQSGLAVLTQLDLVGGDGGSTSDPTRGIARVVVQDCLGVKAPGVTVTFSNADDKTVTTDMHRVPTGPITDSNAVLIFGNLPAGVARVTAQPAGIGPSGTIGVFIHPSSFNHIILRPTPL